MEAVAHVVDLLHQETIMTLPLQVALMAMLRFAINLQEQDARAERGSWATLRQPEVYSKVTTVSVEGVARGISDLVDVAKPRGS